MLQSPKLRKINLRFCFGMTANSRTVSKHLKAFEESLQYRAYMVLVPNGIRPGMQFPVVIKGRKVTLTCPDGAQAGMKLRIRFPKKQPAWKFTGLYKDVIERKKVT